MVDYPADDRSLRSPRAGGAELWLGRPSYSVQDVASLLWRERLVMLAVFLVVAAVGLVGALMLKKTYPSYSSLSVRVGQEYVYRPRATLGDPVQAGTPPIDEVIETEREILLGAPLKERVIQRIGVERLYPELVEKGAPETAAARREVLGKAVKAFSSNLKFEVAPGKPIMRLEFSHPDPVLSALALNRLVEEYLATRKAVLLDNNAPLLEEQRRAFQARLQQADDAYASFLADNGIGDFTAEKASLSGLQASLEDERYRVQARLAEVESRLTDLRIQAGGIAPEVGLYRDADLTTAQKLASLRLDRADLLSRYRPDAQPIEDIDAKIAALEQLQAGGGAGEASARRYGINPVYQAVQTEQIQLAAEAASLRGRAGTLDGQVGEVALRRRRLAGLEPDYQGLVRDRDVLGGQVRDLSVREQQTEAASAIAQGANDNVRVVERATVPTQGKSLRRVAAAAAILFAGFTAFCVGLLRAFLTPGYPSARSAGRTLQLPVLAQVSRR